MILIADVQYGASDIARAAGVMAEDWQDSKPKAEIAIEVTGVAPYQSGQFYLRELPCILALVEMLAHRPTVIVVDGYVDLGPQHPGLGRYLFEAVDIPVIGVAKSSFSGATAEKVYRGGSNAPLYVTAAGIPLAEAAECIFKMHGSYRIPALIKRADSLARGYDLHGQKMCP